MAMSKNGRNGNTDMVAIAIIQKLVSEAAQRKDGMTSPDILAAAGRERLREMLPRMVVVSSGEKTVELATVLTVREKEAWDSSCARELRYWADHCARLLDDRVPYKRMASTLPRRAMMTAVCKVLEVDLAIVARLVGGI